MYESDLEWALELQKQEIPVDLYGDGLADGRADGKKIERVQMELNSTLVKLRWLNDHYEVWPISEVADNNVLANGLYRIFPVDNA